MIAIGVMSGTSCDGADAVALRLRSVEERHAPLLLEHVYQPYPAELRSELLAPERLSVRRVAELHYALGEFYAALVARIGCIGAADVCGVHGQTIWHSPPSQGRGDVATLQIGSGPVVATALNVPVVSDFRSADLALGGEGAPIVPFCHWFFSADAGGSAAVVNVGGIANITHVTRALADVRAWDVGPGMMMVDDFAGRLTDGRLRCDQDGALSAAGAALPAITDRILRHPFFARSPPKSTGREEFGRAFTEELLAAVPAGAAGADVMRSLVEATARGIAGAVAPLGVDALILTGGGARNPTLVAALKQLLPRLPLTVPDSGVLAPDCHEAAAIALIAARTLAGLPSSLPAVTGARRAARLGQVYWP